MISKDMGMQRRWARLAAASGLTLAVASGGVLAGSGAAVAATPVIIGSCATSVQGAPGTPVELSPAAVVQPITNLVDAVPILGPGLAAPFKQAFLALPPIPLGALPTGSGTISGAQVANAVVAQLNNIPLLGPILGTLVTSVRSTLTDTCNVLVTGVNGAAGAAQDGTAAIANGSQQVQQSLGLAPASGGASGSGGGASQSGGGSGSSGSGGGGAASQMPVSNSAPVGGLSGDSGYAAWPSDLLGIGSATSPFERYAGIPFAEAGLFAPSPGVRYGGDVSGYSPGYGVLGQGNNNSDDVQTAGHATALGGIGSLPGGVGLPMLLAVLALSGVTAGLVRTWVLRRVPAA
ncbi:MAG TPA: hypothetical protein VG756_09575 [Pseudonocardiaceae bacterium]|nr:hypothetical protein [Pseudonocardiaceae bacterium]